MWSIPVFVGQVAELGLMDNTNSVGKEKEDSIFEKARLLGLVKSSYFLFECLRSFVVAGNMKKKTLFNLFSVHVLE